MTSGHSLAEQEEVEVRHPLDPLTEREYTTVRLGLRRSEHVGPMARYPLVTLHEPPKADVLRWQSGETIDRKAFVIVKQRRRTHEAVVDAASGEVLSWTPIEGVPPGVLMTEEWSLAVALVLRDPEWQAAIGARGITDLRRVVCTPLTVGNFGPQEHPRRRLAKVICFDARGIGNYWGRPIEGLIATVDLVKRTVELVDTGTVPMPQSPVDLAGESVGELRTPPNPVEATQPLGPSFELDGQRELAEVAFPLPHRSTPGSGDLHGAIRGRRQAAVDSVPGLAIGAVRSLHVAGRGLVLQNLHGRR